MTVVGLNYTAKLEIEWVSGVWTDVTTDVVWSRAVRIKVGRSSEFDDAQPGELTVSLYNESKTNVTGNYTPDNPVSAFYPDVVKGKRIRFTITYSAVSYIRFLGRLKTIEADSLDEGRATVTISAIDSLGAMAQRTLSADWIETWTYRGTTEIVDLWPMDDDVSSTSFRNAGNGVGTMTVVPASGAVGSYQRGSVDQGILLPGQITLSPASGSFVGPVAAIDLGRAMGGAVLTFAVKTSQTVASGDLVLATALDTSGAAVWSLRLYPSGGHTALAVLDETAAGTGYEILNGTLDGSDAWMGVSVYDTGSQSIWFINNAGGWGIPQIRNTNIRYLVLGGRVASWKLLGKQTLCCPVAVAGVAAAASSISDRYDRVRPLVTTSAATRADELVHQYPGITLAQSGTLIPQVTRTDTAGKSALDCYLQVVGTVGGTTWHEYGTDSVQIVWPDATKPRTATATVTVEQDDDASTPFTWRGAGDSKPTRVTVSSAFGSKTARDAYAEDVQHLMQNETWDSCASSVLVAGALAGARLNRSIGARIPQLGVDLTTAANGTTLFPAIMAVRPGYRMTVAGLPSAKLGVSQVDVYAMGWSETWGHESAKFLFDVQPADRPAELVLDDGTYGRLSAGTDASGNPLMTVTSGTAVGATGNGTLVVTTASGPTLTTDAAAYPLQLDWNGECVTITSAPAGSASPQTVTTTARGVNGTVARAHSAGEGIDVWLTPTIAGV